EDDFTKRCAKSDPERAEECGHGERDEHEVCNRDINGANVDVRDDFQQDVRQAKQCHRQDEDHKFLRVGEVITRFVACCCGTAQCACALVYGVHMRSSAFQNAVECG